MDFTAHIRTYTPIVVGWLLVRLGEWVDLTDVDSAGLATAVTGLVIAVYYAIVRVLEQRSHRWGWLLGSPKQPEYS